MNQQYLEHFYLYDANIDVCRQYIAALNGLAGIHVIEEKWAEAAETYRDVLR